MGIGAKILHNAWVFDGAQEGTLLLKLLNGYILSSMVTLEQGSVQYLGCTQELVTFGPAHSPIGSLSRQMVFIQLYGLKCEVVWHSHLLRISIH